MFELELELFDLGQKKRSMTGPVLAPTSFFFFLCEISTFQIVSQVRLFKSMFWRLARFSWFGIDVVSGTILCMEGPLFVLCKIP